MIIFTYEDYLKNILKLDISSVFLKKVLSREDEEEEYEEEQTTECTLCDVSEKYIPDSPDEIDEENKNNNTKEQNKINEKNENIIQNKEDTVKTSKSTINTKRNIRQQLKARRINNEHDKIFRTVLDKKTDVSKFLNKFLGLNIKTEELEKYNSSYIDPKFKNKEADIVYRIKDKNIFLLIEHQTKIDKKMPIRLHEYSTEIMASAMEENKYKSIPSVIPIVLYTGKTKWKIENETIEKQQFFKEVKLIDGEFNLIDINDFSKKELLEDDIFITKMMLVEKCKDEIEMVQALEKIENKIKEEDKSTFRRIVKEIWSLRIGTENANKILEKIEEGSGNMMAVMEMLLAENEKYINIGRQEGMKKGRLEGGKKKIKEIVQKMLAENFTKEMIMKITGLKKEEIEEIK
jgi:predicted transposase/invertase (TIGR01784 family)